MPRQDKERQCHPDVKRLCKLAMCRGHALCHKTNNASYLSGSDMNAYLVSLGSGYGTNSGQGVTIEPNALNDDQDYLVCDNLKTLVEKSQKTRKRRSD